MKTDISSNPHNNPQMKMLVPLQIWEVQWPIWDLTAHRRQNQVSIWVFLTPKPPLPTHHTLHSMIINGFLVWIVHEIFKLRNPVSSVWERVSSTEQARGKFYRKIQKRGKEGRAGEREEEELARKHQVWAGAPSGAHYKKLQAGWMSF